jgi:alpha-beta hydrolase superfamily lysophospholipase
MRAARLALWLLLAAPGLGGCAQHLVPAGPAVTAPRLEDSAFVMADGYRLPYRAWAPEGRVEPPWAVVLALHGMNDSRDAWEEPAPVLAEAGVLVIAPDQRGFGATASRGFWPGSEALAADAAQMAAALRAKYPRARLVLMGESMGAGVLLLAATGPAPPEADLYVLLSPAIWGRAEMSLPVRAGLALAAGLVPGMTVSGRAAGRVASDNPEALRRLSRNRLTIRETRFDAVRGVVDLMDAARAAAARMGTGVRVPVLVLYGGKDEVIPPGAMRRVWRDMGAGARRAFYPEGYHLLLRDRNRAVPTADILAWLRRPEAPLPSGAEDRVAEFLAGGR